MYLHVWINKLQMLKTLLACKGKLKFPEGWEGLSQKTFLGGQGKYMDEKVHFFLYYCLILAKHLNKSKQFHYRAIFADIKIHVWETRHKWNNSYLSTDTCNLN